MSWLKIFKKCDGQSFIFLDKPHPLVISPKLSQSLGPVQGGFPRKSIATRGPQDSSDGDALFCYLTSLVIPFQKPNLADAAPADRPIPNREKDWAETRLSALPIP